MKTTTAVTACALLSSTVSGFELSIPHSTRESYKVPVPFDCCFTATLKKRTRPVYFQLSDEDLTEMKHIEEEIDDVEVDIENSDTLSDKIKRMAMNLSNQFLFRVLRRTEQQHESNRRSPEGEPPTANTAIQEMTSSGHDVHSQSALLPPSVSSEFGRPLEVVQSSVSPLPTTS